MSFIKFILGKIVIVEIMLLLLYFSLTFFNLSLSPYDTILITCLKYLTPIAAICFIPYLILSVLGSDFVKMIISIIIGILLVFYFVTYFNLI